jgi:hypothetical protein
VRVSDASNDDGRAKGSNSDTGVLANLPRTRPQRSSARRAAARKAASTPASAPPKAKLAKAKLAKAKPARAEPAAAKAAKAAKAKPTKARPTQAKRPTDATSQAETVPRQGFEVEGEIASGAVQPPGAAELVSSAAELAGELAKAGVNGGARLLKDLFARLPPG